MRWVDWMPIYGVLDAEREKQGAASSGRRMAEAGWSENKRIVSASIFHKNLSWLRAT